MYYQLKMTAECLGIQNKDLMNLQTNTLHQKTLQQKEQIEDVINFIEDESNELDVGFCPRLISSFL
jgi:hypothetical protein